MFAPEPTTVHIERKYDCVHQVELFECQRMMEFASYESGCLCFCMTSFEELPEPNDSAAYRDTLAVEALKLLGFWPTTLNYSHSNYVNPGVHCYANLNNLERLIPNMEAAWKPYYPANQHIILDNCRMPNGYVGTVLKDGFFKEVLPHFLDKKTKLLAPGGKIWLPNIPDITDNLSNIEKFTDGPITFVEDPYENPLIQARELVKDQLLLATTDYTNDTQLAVLRARTSFPFVVLTKLSEEEGTSSLVTRIRQKRNNSRDVDVATPHPSARKRTRTASTSSSSSGATTNASSTSPRVHSIIDLTQCCDCNDEFTPNCKGVKKPRACSICMSTPMAGRVGFTP